jgi:hypothetical protein
MDLTTLLADIEPEEIEPRLELQIFIDPLSLVAADRNNNCSVKDACNIKIGS